jgi:magnesium-protoporphyrin O-methyltransferase
MHCCDTQLSDVFSADVSRKDADRYRKRGLPPRARKLVAGIESIVALKGKRTLEIGVGVGAVTIELLRKGAASATGVDAVASQLEQARVLASEKGVADRLELVHSDFTATTQIAHADVVVLDRVVCCYPDWRGLLGAAAAHADVGVALTYPRNLWWVRLVWWLSDLWLRFAHDGFRLFIHPPQHMHALLAKHGFSPRVVGHYYWWEIAVASRPTK